MSPAIARWLAACGPSTGRKLTADLASVFRSAAERAGLHLRVHCESLSEDVYVDREMWEKIVLNLLSNAFKSTFEGEICVSLRSSSESAELVISDTGTGIPANEIPHLFERFRRIEGARRRTNEGSGIGLALVSELVQMHGGVISVASQLGIGTSFTVRIPFGTAHLAADRVSREVHERSASSISAEAYVQEALSWLPETGSRTPIALNSNSDAESSVATPVSSLGSVLLVDDNRDMRDYVGRLLSQRFKVATAENGRIALATARANPPDLVLTDVMMPEMDGFELLAALRSDPLTNQVPVIMLSARAGEEARVEGLQAGADDYLVKPFTARELLARVESHVRMAQFRRQALEHEAELRLAIQHARNLAAEAVEHISDGFWTYDSSWRITYINPAAQAMSNRSREEQVGQTLWEVFPELLGTPLEQHFRRAMESREIVEFEFYLEA